MEPDQSPSAETSLSFPGLKENVRTEARSFRELKGITIDHLTRKPVQAELEIVDNKTGKVIETFKSNSATGKFLLSLEAGKNYGIAVKADGYLFHSENFDIPSAFDPTVTNLKKYTN